MLFNKELRIKELCEINEEMLEHKVKRVDLPGEYFSL